MTDVLIRGGRPRGLAFPAGPLVRDGRVHRVGASLDAPGALVLDVSGRLLLPGLVDAPCHLDKTLHGGPWVPRSPVDVQQVAFPRHGVLANPGTPSGCPATAWLRATGPTSSWCPRAAPERPWSFTLGALWS